MNKSVVVAEQNWDKKQKTWVR